MIHFVYNPDSRDVPTGNYLLDAAKRRGIPVSWSSKGPLAGAIPSLLIKVDDGDYDQIDYNHICDCPTAWWFIDPDTDFERGHQIGKHFDYIFCSQLTGANKLRDLGLNAYWLPLGCDPVYHNSIYPTLQDRPFDVGFSGSTNKSFWNPQRPIILNKISENFSNHIIQNTNKGENAMVNGSCKVVFNDNPYNNINMRHFEAISAGSILVTKKVYDNGFESLDTSESVLLYESEEEAIELIGYALDNINNLEFQSKELSNVYKKNHSYDSRLTSVISAAGGLE